MIDLLLFLFLLAALNWAVLDIYFESILFDRIRKYGETWEQAQSTWRYVRYMLNCPFCFSHWTAAVILAVFVLIGYLGYVPVVLHPIAALLLIPVVARTALTIKDNTLPPIVNVPPQTYKDTETSDGISGENPA